jgi:predicted lipid-binding transport protein (Tim44 family)
LGESEVNVVPIQSPPQEEGAQSKCASCGAEILSDQRYCLCCGKPCAPVRLAFLDVLQAESQLRAPTTLVAPAAGYIPPPSDDGGVIGSLRRYSGLLGLLAVLLITGLIGLLIGHWLTPSSKLPTASIIKIEGGLPAAVATSPVASTPATPATPSSSKAATSKSAHTSEAQEVKEVKEAETAKVKPKAPVKTSSSTLKKLSSSKGKAHQQEIEKLTAGDQPIETGG